MSDTAVERPWVAFYHNRNKLHVERAIDFRPDLADSPQGWDVEEVILPEKMDTYRALCKRAIGLTTRLLFLPREASYMRSLVTVDSGRITRSKPTGGYVEIRGSNFKSSFHMGYVDFMHHGLASHGLDRSFAEVGRLATVGGFILSEENGSYFNVDIGQNACLADAGSSSSSRIAQPEFVKEWIDKVLEPLEVDIKAHAYTWTGDGKTVPDQYDRLI